MSRDTGRAAAGRAGSFNSGKNHRQKQTEEPEEEENKQILLMLNHLMKAELNH